MLNEKLPLSETIYQLRTIEQAILYDSILTVSKAEEEDTTSFLMDEYEKEKLNYPFQPPEFEPKAALWAAKTIYFATQFLINRKDTVKDFNIFLPNYNATINPSAVLSADLCLRFLPFLLNEFSRIDPEDVVIPILEGFLTTFHYSSIGYDLKTDYQQLNFDILKQNNCLEQLYLNRITEKKALPFVEIPYIKQRLMANFGDYQKVFWTDFELINNRDL